MAQLLKIEGFATKEIVLQQKPINEVLKESEEKRRENTRIEKENTELERKAKLQSIVDVVASDLQKIIDATDSFEKIEENEKQFNSILAVFDNSVEEKTIDLQDYDVVYQDMVLEKSEAFDSLIKQLTTQYDLEQSNKALEVARLTNERMSELFDYDYKYKGEKALGELSIEDYAIELKCAKFYFRKKAIELIGLIGNDALKSWIYATDTDVILVKITFDELNDLTDAEFEAKVNHFKTEIEEWNNPKEVEVNEIEVDLSEKNKEVEQVEVIQENNENKAVLIDNSEFDKEAKENLENTISLEPKEENNFTSRYQELFNYLHDLGVIALDSEMQEIERIVLKMQE